MQFTVLAMTILSAAGASAAPQVDAGCTLSCGVWNGCRARAVIEGNPLTDWFDTPFTSTISAY